MLKPSVYLCDNDLDLIGIFAGSVIVSQLGFLDTYRCVRRLHISYNPKTLNFRRYIRVEKIMYYREWSGEAWVVRPNNPLENRCRLLNTRLELETPQETNEFRVFARKRDIELKVRRQRELSYYPLRDNSWLKVLKIESTLHKRILSFKHMLQTLNDDRSTQYNELEQNPSTPYLPENVHFIDTADKTDLLAILTKILDKYEATVQDYEIN